MNLCTTYAEWTGSCHATQVQSLTSAEWREQRLDLAEDGAAKAGQSAQRAASRRRRTSTLRVLGAGGMLLLVLHIQGPTPRIIPLPSSFPAPSPHTPPDQPPVRPLEFCTSTSQSHADFNKEDRPLADKGTTCATLAAGQPRSPQRCPCSSHARLLNRLPIPALSAPASCSAGAGCGSPCLDGSWGAGG
jgi:hypothetical protein